MELKDRIAEALRVANKSPTQVAAETGLSDSAISQLLSGKTKNLRASTAVKLEISTGIRTAWLVNGDGPKLSTGTAVIEAMGEALQTIELPACVRVGVLANSASMGGGEEPQDADVMLGTITLAQDFVRQRLRVKHGEKLRFIHAHGDSMAPTFSSGDVLLVDTGITEVKIDGIYVLRAHERLFIKRVRQRLDGNFEVSSDNPTHRTVDVLNGSNPVTVLGRVVWVWSGRNL